MRSELVALLVLVTLSTLWLASSAEAQTTWTADPSKDCNAFWHHNPHNFSPVTCERENNPHYELSLSFGANACTGQAGCCKNCYACCNGSRDEQFDCFCEEKPSWLKGQCKNAANTRLPGCLGECLGTFGTGCSGIPNSTRQDSVLDLCDKCGEPPCQP